MKPSEQDYVLDLIERLKPHLPMTVTPGKALLATLRSDDKRDVKLKKDTRLKVVNAHYLGVEGGLALACEPPAKVNNNMLVNSITHLKLDPKHPLYKELRAYQLARIAWLAQGNRRNGLITQL
ncbi:hypothetical protein [Endozoicomonas sp. SCSIO W0465]|uniref:hypothetical protein n=1 Tax=Endozoicomonas sp. SCSIO W0465 TaxID=2918516 RepID=UPI0020754557|nr:hypothetical protein [Endozoicomonas sp. SCSIO W0465]USE35455.1 hypothetical protein MJO57_25695 [Endozoicomonas sp. SCSIO W0465]